MKVDQINSFKVGNAIKGFFLCEEKYFKSTRLGDPFIDIIIADSTGKIRCKIWKNAYFYNEKFSVGDPVAIKGSIINYKNKIEIEIKHISSVKNTEYDEYGYTESLIVKTIDISHQKLWKIINKNIKSLSGDYKIIASHLYKKYKSKIIALPSCDTKYELHGGFIMKIANICKINDRLIPLFNQPGIVEHGRQSSVDIVNEKYKSTFHLYYTSTTNEVDCVIHTGDITQAKTLEKFCKLNCPLIAVFGNNDLKEHDFQAYLLKGQQYDVLVPPH